MFRYVMRFPTTLPEENLLANAAFIFLVPQVNIHVRVQASFVLEEFVTKLAFDGRQRREARFVGEKVLSPGDRMREAPSAGLSFLMFIRLISFRSGNKVFDTAQSLTHPCQLDNQGRA
jgi:hypothetical protein